MSKIQTEYTKQLSIQIFLYLTIHPKEIINEKIDKHKLKTTKKKFIN